MAFEKLKKIFGKKEEPPVAPAVPEPPKPITTESAGTENVKAKIDLLMTQLENMNVKYETLNQRLANIERMIQEIYVIAKR